MCVSHCAAVVDNLLVLLFSLSSFSPKKLLLSLSLFVATLSVVAKKPVDARAWSVDVLASVDDANWTLPSFFFRDQKDKKKVDLTLTFWGLWLDTTSAVSSRQTMVEPYKNTWRDVFSNKKKVPNQQINPTQAANDSFSRSITFLFSLPSGLPGFQ